MRRPSLTLLYLGGDRTLRVDLGAQGDAVWAIERPAWSGEADSLGALLGDRRLAPQTYILQESLWTQTIDLAALPLSGLPDSEVARALAYELEPLSSIPVADSALAFRRLENRAADRARFWVVQSRASAVARLAERVTASGSRLRGVAHPGGLWAITGREARVEVWDSTTCCWSGSELTVIAARAGQRSWTRALQEWLAREHGPVAWRGRARPSMLETPPSNGQVLDRGALPSEENPPAWLAARAESLANRSAPVLPPPSRPARRLSPRLVGAVLAVGIVAAAAFEIRRDVVQASDLETRAQTIEENRIRTARAVAESVQRGREFTTLTDANRTLAAKMARIESEWQMQRARPMALVQALASCRPPGVVVTKIQPGPLGVIDLVGIGTQVEAIDRMAVDLATKLESAGYEIAPARTQVRDLGNGRHCFEFSIQASLDARGWTP